MIQMGSRLIQIRMLLNLYMETRLNQGRWGQVAHVIVTALRR
jgi:hypothetical protein